MCCTRCKLLFTGLLALAVFAITDLRADAQTKLRYQFKAGEKLPYELEQKMKMAMNVGGQNIEMNMTQNVDLIWDVKSVDKDGKASMVQRFDRIRFVMEGPMGKIEFDSKDEKESDDPAAKLITPVFKAMAGAEFTLDMDRRGVLSNVKTPEKLVEALKGAAAVPGLGNMFSEEGVKHLVTQSGLVLPEEGVTKGKSWEQKVEMKSPVGKMKTDNTLTYQGPATRGDRKLEEVSIKPVLTIEADDAAPIALKVKDQDSKGTALFDNAAGRLVETNMKQTMQMEISAGGMTIDQKIEQTVSMKLKEKK